MTPLHQAILALLSYRDPQAAWEIDHDVKWVRGITATADQVDAALESLAAVGLAELTDEGWRRIPEQIAAATVPQGVLFQ